MEQISCIIKQTHKAFLNTHEKINKNRTEDGKAHAEQLLNLFYQAENKAIRGTLKLYPVEFVDAIIYYNKCLSVEFNSGLEADDKQ